MGHVKSDKTGHISLFSRLRFQSGGRAGFSCFRFRVFCPLSLIDWCVLCSSVRFLLHSLLLRLEITPCLGGAHGAFPGRYSERERECGGGAILERNPLHTEKAAAVVPKQRERPRFRLLLADR